VDELTLGVVVVACHQRRHLIFSSGIGIGISSVATTGERSASITSIASSIARLPRLRCRCRCCRWWSVRMLRSTLAGRRVACFALLLRGLLLAAALPAASGLAAARG
jgi:hypothetical protein